MNGKEYLIYNTTFLYQQLEEKNVLCSKSMILCSNCLNQCLYVLNQCSYVILKIIYNLQIWQRLIIMPWSADHYNPF